MMYGNDGQKQYIILAPQARNAVAENIGTSVCPHLSLHSHSTMAAHSIITDEQLKSFQDDGFLHIRRKDHGLIPDPAEPSRWADEIVSWPREKGKWMPYDELNAKGEKQLMRTENIVAYYPPVKDLLCGEGVFSMLKQLSGKVSSGQDRDGDTSR